MKFNIVQSTISSLPALTILQFVHLKTTPTFDNLPEFDKVFESLTAFVVPFALLLTVFSIGWTLPNRLGQSPDAVKRAARCLGRHYLYLDAAYGMYPQAVCALAWMVSSPTLLLSAWQAVVTFRQIPNDLYAEGELGQPMTLLNADEKTPYRGFATA
jgi:hypothetical protein